MEILGQQNFASFLNVYENQRECAKEIFGEFLGGRKWITLSAQMQAGKTGIMTALGEFLTIDAVAASVREVFDGNMVIITGVNDNSLKHQTAKRVPFKNTKVFHNADLQQFLKGKDAHLIREWKQGRPLVVIDESHFGAETSGVLSKFLKLIGVPPSGSGEWRSNAKVLSVSATPIAECYNLGGKKHIIFSPGEGYHSVSTMLSNGLVRQSWELDYHGASALAGLVRMLPAQTFAIVRVSKPDTFRAVSGMLRDVAHVIKFDSNNHADFNDIVKTPPNSKTVIFIFKKLSAGSTFTTEHIHFMFDTHDSSTDTTSQSLLGRACGYHKNINTVVYCDVKRAQDYATWVESGFSAASLPTKALHVVEKRRVLNSKAAIPVVLKCDDIMSMLDGGRVPDKKTIVASLYQENEGFEEAWGEYVFKNLKIVRGNGFDRPWECFQTQKPYKFGTNQDGPKVLSILVDVRPGPTQGKVLMISVDRTRVERIERVGVTMGHSTVGLQGEMFYQK